MAKKKERKFSDKTIGIMMGIAITLGAIGIVSAFSISSAHSNENGVNNMMNDGMMSNNEMMPMMHSMMMGDTMMDNNDMMACMSMMKNHAEMGEEEIDEMLRSMDKDGDGLCDYCGMSIEACRKMMS